MKFICLLVFTTVTCFSQKHNFIVDKNNLFWQIEFKSEADHVLDLIDKNDHKISTNIATNTGNCIDISFGGITNTGADGVSFDFELTKTKDTYIITIENFKYGKFDNVLDNYFLNKKHTEIEDSSKKQKLLQLMNQKLTKLLTPAGSILIQ